MGRIAFEEMDGYPQESEDANGFKATRQVKIDWGDRDQFRAELYGTVYPYNLRSLAIAKSVTIKGFGAQGKKDVGSGSSYATYPAALVTITYETPQPGGPGVTPVIHDGYRISESVEPTIEFITLDPAKFQWGAGSSGEALASGEAQGFQVRGMEWVFTKFARPSLPSSIIGLVGKCNNAPLTSPSLGLTFAAEQLLFHAPQISRVADNAFDVTYRFTVRDQTWNKYWRAKTGTFEAIYLRGSSTLFKSYPPANLSVL